jgi:hypothetical protein
MLFVSGVAKGCLGALFVFPLVETSGCTESPEPDEPPLVVHVKEPKTPLMPDWETDAVLAAFDAACPEGAGGEGEQSWSTRAISRLRTTPERLSRTR